MRRLYLQIFLAFLLIGIVAVSAAFVAGRYLFIPHQPPVSPVARGAAQLLAEGIPPDAPRDVQQATLESIAATLHVEMVLWDMSGSPPVRTPGADLDPPGPDAPEASWWREHGRSTLRARLPDGRVLGVVFPDAFDLPWYHFVGVFAVLALSIGLMCYPLARRITRRLERLQTAVDGLAAGDLRARVDVAGRDEIADLARQFNRAADRIEVLVAGQRRMLASASHELRSPLARVRMALELIADAAPGQRGIVGDATRDIEELDGLVGDLLLASRLEARPPVREPVDLAALAADEAARAGASHMSPETAFTSGEPAALRRLLRNLLDNARRHGQPPIELAVESHDTTWRIAVDDAGPGVPEAERERIFEAFYRPAGHREGDGGVGLGLALVRQIAERHGGAATCEARPGGGTRFVVTLPRARLST
jgi:signal transduction histidine kinase